jgi:hypothetical protein
LTIEGRRLDDKASPLHAAIPGGYGDKGFQPSGIRFPTEGCWEVTGSVGNTKLTFVTLILRAARYWPMDQEAPKRERAGSTNVAPFGPRVPTSSDRASDHESEPLCEAAGEVEGDEQPGVLASVEPVVASLGCVSTVWCRVSWPRL